MLSFPPPCRISKWKNIVSKPNTAENVSNLLSPAKQSTSVCNRMLFVVLREGTLYKEMQAFEVVTHPGFLLEFLPCLSGSCWLNSTYCMKTLEKTKPQSFCNHSFFFFSFFPALLLNFICFSYYFGNCIFFTSLL